MKTAPSEPRSTVLTEAQGAMVVAFRRPALLPFDDCLYSLQPSIPHLTRSALHRCLQRHGISRLPEMEGDTPKRSKFKRYPIGFFHIDIAEVQTAEGKRYLFVGIDRTSKFTMTGARRQGRQKDRLGIPAAYARSRGLTWVHTILTDRAIGTPLVRGQWSSGIGHRLTKPNHPWSCEDQKTVRGTVFLSGGQVERMNRTIKEATVKRFPYDSHDQLRTHLSDFRAAYNFARRLKTLGGLTPYEYICKIWTAEPDRFIQNPIHKMPGPNT